MKKILFFVAALAALSLASCQKSSMKDVPSSTSLGGQKAIVSLSISGTPSTKDVLQTADEAKVSGIQVFIFNGDAVDGYKNAEASEISSLIVSIEATAGTRDIYAFVNAPDLSAYTSKAGILAAVSALSDNASDKYVMSGKLENQSIGASYSGTVKVDRYATRVRISKITRNMSNAALQSVDFQITKLYLTSVASNEKYDFSAPAAYTWLNASFGDNRALSTDNAFVYNKLASPAPVANNASYTTAHSFYAYANENADDDTADPQTFKQTRLVIECQIDADGSGSFSEDEYFTYPIKMGALESNKSYEIKELIITILGNQSNGDDNADDGEDKDIEKITSSVTVEVNDWGEVLVGDNGTVTI